MTAITSLTGRTGGGRGASRRSAEAIVGQVGPCLGHRRRPADRHNCWDGGRRERRGGADSGPKPRSCLDPVDGVRERRSAGRRGQVRSSAAPGQPSDNELVEAPPDARSGAGADGDLPSLALATSGSDGERVVTGAPSDAPRSPTHTDAAQRAPATAPGTAASRTEQPTLGARIQRAGGHLAQGSPAEAAVAASRAAERA